jgi:hypothetical protein
MLATLLTLVTKITVRGVITRAFFVLYLYATHMNIHTTYYVI